MALRPLLNAATALDAARRTIDALIAEKQGLQERIAAINLQLAAARADAAAAVATVRAEAVDVVTP